MDQYIEQLINNQNDLKQSCLPAFWEKKRSKTHKRLKERFLIDETGENVQIFEEVLFFKLRTKKYKQKNNTKANN